MQVLLIRYTKGKDMPFDQGDADVGRYGLYQLLNTKKRYTNEKNDFVCSR